MMSRGGVVVTAPVAERAWILHDWYECLAEQTVKPAEIILLHSGKQGDATWVAIEECASEYGILTHRLHDPSVPHQRHDNTRFRTLARLRNQLLATSRIICNQPILLSLDTDVLLENENTIEELIPAAERYGCASPLVYLHPDMKWTVNAGMLKGAAMIEHATREELECWPWERAEPTPAALDGASVQPIDIPMAAIAMNRQVVADCRYGHHESGEDIAFGISLKRRHQRAVWLPSIEARHVWSETHLDALNQDQDDA